jgi:hypothetical protein
VTDAHPRMRLAGLVVMALATAAAACGRRKATHVAILPTTERADAPPARYGCKDFARDFHHTANISAAAMKFHGHDAETFSDCVELPYGLLGYYLAPGANLTFGADIVIQLRTEHGTSEIRDGIASAFNALCPIGDHFVWCYRANLQAARDVVLAQQRVTLRTYDFGFAQGVRLEWPRGYQGDRAYDDLYLAQPNGYLGAFARFAQIGNQSFHDVLDEDKDGKLDVVLRFANSDVQYLGHNTGAAFDFSDAAAKEFVRRECEDVAPFVVTKKDPCPSSMQFGCSLIHGREPALDNACVGQSSGEEWGPRAFEPKVALTTLP